MSDASILQVNVTGASVHKAVRNIVTNEFGINGETIRAMVGDRIATMLNSTDFLNDTIVRAQIQREIASNIGGALRAAVHTEITSPQHDLRAAIESDIRGTLASEWGRSLITQTLERVVTSMIKAEVKAAVASVIADTLKHGGAIAVALPPACLPPA